MLLPFLDKGGYTLKNLFILVFSENSAIFYAADMHS